jgi:hypothetical protein
VSIKTRLRQLERTYSALNPPEPEMTDEELLASLRWFFQIGYLKLEGMEVVSTIEHPDLPYYEECAGLAELLSERALNRPDKPLIFVTRNEAQVLLELLETDQLGLNPIRELVGSVKYYYLWPNKRCELSGADQLARNLDTALDAWAEQTIEKRPVTLEEIEEWVRALVGGTQEKGE